MPTFDDMMMAAGGGYLPLIDILTALSLTTNLKICLDAGHDLSYGGSGQDWLDTSGNLGADEFHMGTTASADAADPTFNGVAGGLSAGEFFGFDGGDSFHYGAALEAWMKTLHKDGAAFSLLIALYTPAGANGTMVADVQAVLQYDPGFNISFDATSMNFHVTNGSAFQHVASSDAKPYTDDSWNIIGATIDENGGAAASFFWANGGYVQVGASDTFNAAYTSPGAADPSYDFTIGDRGDGSVPLSNGCRIAGLAMWEGGTISKANFDAIHAMFKGRFGL